MKRTLLFAPAALFAGLVSAPSLAHGGATVAVGLPPVAVDVAGVQVVIGMPPPPPVPVVVHEPTPPPRVLYLREAPRSTVVVYPRHREPVVTREVIVVDGDGCDHPGRHYGHYKHHDKHHGQHHRHDDDDGGVWR